MLNDNVDEKILHKIVVTIIFTIFVYYSTVFKKKKMIERKKNTSAIFSSQSHKQEAKKPFFKLTFTSVLFSFAALAACLIVIFYWKSIIDKSKQYLRNANVDVTPNNLAPLSTVKSKPITNRQEQQQEKQQVIIEKKEEIYTQMPYEIFAKRREESLKNDVLEQIKLVRAIKRKGVVMTEDSEAIRATEKLQDMIRSLLYIQYGPDPYKVEMFLKFPDSMIENGNATALFDSLIIELAPIKLVPYSVYYFLSFIGSNWKVFALFFLKKT
jgi:hypothetical protein